MNLVAKEFVAEFSLRRRLLGRKRCRSKEEGGGLIPTTTLEEERRVRRSSSSYRARDVRSFIEAERRGADSKLGDPRKRGEASQLSSLLLLLEGNPLLLLSRPQPYHFPGLSVPSLFVRRKKRGGTAPIAATGLGGRPSL